MGRCPSTSTTRARATTTSGTGAVGRVGTRPRAGSARPKWTGSTRPLGPGMPSAVRTRPPHYKFYSMKQEKDSEGNLYMHVIGVAGDAIDPGVTNEDFRIYGFSEAW